MRKSFFNDYDEAEIADWWCKAQDPRKLIANHPSFLAAEVIFSLLCILTFCHAYRHGGRYLYTWIGITIVALFSESIRFWNEKLDLFWHAQGVLTFCGMRTPLYAIFGIYQMLLYSSYVMARRLRLPLWAEGPAVGLLVVVISFPLQVIGVKLLWWQWHDSDPSMTDRIYSVPWSMLFFDACTGCSFTWVLHILRRFFLPQKYDWRLFVREFVCVFVAAILGLCLCGASFVAILHPLRDILEISSGVVTLILLATYAVIAIIADRHNNDREARPQGERRFWFDELACAVCIYYIFYMTLIMIVRPENVVAEGLHQPIGLCNITELLDTPTGVKLERQKYICAYGHEGNYFDFHCLPGGLAPEQIGDEPLEWYIICGTPFENRFEYIAVIWSWSILAMVILYEVAARSGTTPADPVKKYVKRGAIPKYSPPTRPKITSVERQDSEELKGLVEGEEEESMREPRRSGETKAKITDVKRTKSPPKVKSERSLSEGRSPSRSEVPTHLPMPTRSHELRSRKRRTDA
uniref:Intimal thickness related receptor IRP domain-containing protein n=1 Tax=Ascaris lumbricoides TaxID=6252 RepID=A0A9J2PDY5_ASCLU